LLRCQSEAARIERNAAAEDFFAASLARQLCELYERLLDHVAQRPLGEQHLAQAAIHFFLDAAATSEDEDEDESQSTLVSCEQLREARAVLRSVLAYFELDWLDWT